MIDPKALLADLRAEVKNLEQDLRPRALADERLRQEWQQARDAGRTAANFENPWLPERITQIAVAWVLATTFVRFAEDNGLLEYPFITGPTDPDDPTADRAAQARERQEEYFQQPDHRGETDREWLGAAFEAMSVAPAARSLFEEHNPIRQSVRPTHDAAKALIAFWRKTGPDGKLVHDFTDPAWDTRFLGNLYQDLSDDAKKTYALLQTPEFVEEFILDYTLKPAIEEFGLEPEPPYGHADLPRILRVIDPACGSGHFLLGAFHRLLRAWDDYAPQAETLESTDKWTLINRALQSVHGVDKNPYAAAIARFRLLLAAMREGDVKRLAKAVDFPVNVAVGDSLLHGYRSYGSEDELPFEKEGEDKDEAFTYRTEDIDVYIKSVHMLAFGSYHAVFGNPPYITVRDKAESARYRKRYMSCYREYSLSVPFAERIFKLAVRGSVGGVGAGYTGQITGNAFTKNEFGKRLINEFFANIDLTHIIDTSGAYIPGHGTPTIILFGRWCFPRPGSTIRTIVGIRGEPNEPAVAKDGLVWRSIESLMKNPGSPSEWVSASDLGRNGLKKHPWSLGGNAVRAVMDSMEAAGRSRLVEDVAVVGYIAISGLDDAYFLPDWATLRRRGLESGRVLVTGDAVRDFNMSPDIVSIWPYDEAYTPSSQESIPHIIRYLWPHRHNLEMRKRFSVPVRAIPGFAWYEFRELYSSRLWDPLTIAFASVASHNHFVLDRGGKIFNRHSPVIKLKEGAEEGNHLALTALLNSSIACFWLKQVSHDKGNRGGERSTARYAWENFYEFTGTKLEQFPLPATRPTEFGRKLDDLAQQYATAATREVHESTRAQMIALQEELDWSVYGLYGLLSDDEVAQLVAPPGSVPELKLGERAFEFLLAERLDGEQGERQWFERHHSDPITEIPAHWPDEYKAVVARRIEFIRTNRNIGLIERPEYKRRWEYDPWDAKEQTRLSTWLLDRCEDRELWFDESGQPRPLTVSNLADRLRRDPEAVSVARQLAGEDADMFQVIGGLVDTEHVPYLAQLRYKGEGLVKRAVWERTWAMQREEDEQGKRLDIPVPPRYTSADFLRPSFWRNRGKLDVPKERFVSYPGASPASDDSLLLGWAGWDHREQAHVLVTLIGDRATTDGWGKDRLTPLIAGLAEVMPWVRQWHAEPTEFGQSWADAYDAFLTQQRERHGLSDDDLKSWKPPQRPGRRGSWSAKVATLA